ncbi:MAG TPA: hypothetical protein VHN80_04355, partial [Kineosporiaceae bacterium]|nr:hypothetical protein [Kineosporiaceae bacterium]
VRLVPLGDSRTVRRRVPHALALVLLFLAAMCAALAAGRLKRWARRVHRPSRPGPRARTVGDLRFQPHPDTSAEVHVLKHGDHQLPTLALHPHPVESLDPDLTEVSR